MSFDGKWKDMRPHEDRRSEKWSGPFTHENDGEQEKMSPAADAPLGEQSWFLRLVYLHFALTSALFLGLEWLLLAQVPDSLRGKFFDAIEGKPWAILAVVGAFAGVGLAAMALTSSHRARWTQYAGLALFVVAQASVTLPVLWLAKNIYPDVAPVAGVFFAMVVGGLAAIFLATSAAFPWWARWLAYLAWSGFAFFAVGTRHEFTPELIATGVTIAGIGLLVLHYTRHVLKQYAATQYVGAAVALFAAPAAFAWWIIKNMKKKHYTKRRVVP